MTNRLENEIWEIFSFFSQRHRISTTAIMPDANRRHQSIASPIHTQDSFYCHMASRQLESTGQLYVFSVSSYLFRSISHIAKLKINIFEFWKKILNSYIITKVRAKYGVSACCICHIFLKHRPVRPWVFHQYEY